MTETKIKGLKVLLDDDYIEIVDAYQINNKEKMKDFITEACDKMDFCIIKRTMDSMVRQWAFTNRMYRWHILKKKHSKCIITNKINWFKTMIYFLLGFQQIRFAKIKKRLEKRKMNEVALGTLYDVNKGLVAKNEIELTEGVINSKKEIVKNFIMKTENAHYMLLCKEQSDYTIFRRYNMEDTEKAMEISNILIDECLKNRGEIRGIDLTKDKDAIEIWLLIEEEAYCYYFFPYDAAVIEV